MHQTDNPLRVAAYQMRVTANIENNLIKINSAIQNAAEQKAVILALPECALSGYPPLHHSSADEIDATKIAEMNDEVCQAARKNGIAVVLGTILMSSDGLLNSALVISRTGEIVGHYDKTHLIGGDKEFFVPGGTVRAFDLDGLTVGVLICYDVRFPEPFRYLRELGAQLMIVILNACGGDTWKVPVLEGNFRTRAAENSCFLVACNAAGPLQMATSRICDPRGLDLASANQDCEEMLFADIDVSQADSGHFYSRRTDLFEVTPKFGPA